jgi:hypothetical protein
VEIWVVEVGTFPQKAAILFGSTTQGMWRAPLHVNDERTATVTVGIRLAVYVIAH